MKAAILTYHPIHIVDNTYSGNDLWALREDLSTIDRLGIRVESLEQLFTEPGREELLRDGDGLRVAITFDDGACFDYVNRVHPTCGPQRSAASVLLDARRTNVTLAGATPLATSFVIASPQARAELDAKDYFGGNYWPDDWWGEAVSRRVLAVESHSWDHNHPSLARTAQRSNARGTFLNIETYAEAEVEIARSLHEIETRSGSRPRFFAYPWGEASRFLSHEYLPTRGVELGLWAAFGGGEASRGIATSRDDRWCVPRLVCGYDWKTSQQLASLLDAAR